MAADRAVDVHPGRGAHHARGQTRLAAALARDHDAVGRDGAQLRPVCRDEVGGVGHRGVAVHEHHLVGGNGPRPRGEGRGHGLGQQLQRLGGGAVLPSGGLAPVRRARPALTLVGLADAAANGTYALAVGMGPVTVAASLAALDPVVTAVAARGVLRERLRAVQAAGAALALAGTLLLASG
ncbi:hypothetical protein DEH69_20375 [Streptomyces sp. PT12]|nr:hypothetical protein DEH69_20375 [Streptomyces sp. PT12]